MGREFANPGPLGLCAFGMTTLILNMHNAGWFELTSVVLAMGLVYGGFIQIVAGVLDYINGNTFGLTAFASYGSFWISFAFMKLLPSAEVAQAPTEHGVAAWLLLWGIFTTVMILGTLKSNYCLTGVFSTLALLFFLLTAADFSGNATLRTVAGWEGLFVGILALYTGLAEVVNDTLKKDLLPLGHRSINRDHNEATLKDV